MSATRLRRCGCVAVALLLLFGTVRVAEVDRSWSSAFRTRILGEGSSPYSVTRPSDACTLRTVALVI
jgi:hypothetical protein